MLEGYGLPETTAPATLNTPDLIKIGTVGHPLPGVAIAIADDGEVLIRGNNVFSSYRNNQTATREALVDGWFHTGDIGDLDEEGFPGDHQPQEGAPGHRRRQERRPRVP